MDRYTKIKKIGEGSFGKALLVRHKENGKQFVVKEINMSKMAKKERDEARKEVAVLAQLNHPNIVMYRESFEEIGNLYIVMDFCDGGDLYGRINTQRGVLFEENQIIDWFVQTCLAIKHIHDRKILHRDIKSQNIFLTRHGIVKLGDFGIAKVLNSTVELARTCIGTPYYLSPEICENKPYNNKSDIWSLGCVLYELTTLKHAFEAGNMKNLVLKIIRGNFPPPAPRYSYELRSLINQLFKRSPRDRPSINTVLKKPILQQRIKKFLSESEVADEFSHTVMHGVKMKKVLPAGGVRPLPPKPVAVKKPPSVPAPSPRYNPASVYGVPVNRKSRDTPSAAAGGVKKSSDARRSAGAKKPSSSGGAAAYNADLARKKQELLEKERKRREEAKKKEDMYAKQHRELVERQKLARINKAREEGWKYLVGSLGSDDSNRKLAPHGAKLPSKKKPYVSPYSQNKSSPRSDEFKKPAPVYKPVRPAVAAGNVVKDQRPNYDHYHDYLDKLERERKAAPAARPVSARDEPVSGRDKAAVDVQKFDPAYNAMKGQAEGAQGHAAAEKARMVSEFMQRKQQAAVNKARAQGDLFGGAKLAVNPPRPAPSPKPSSGAPTPSAGQQKPQSSHSSESRYSNNQGRPVSDKQKAEQEYLARLKHIRLQNFNERRSVQDKQSPKGDDRYKPGKSPDPKYDADARKKKIEALRAQADERAKKLKAELERKRKEAYELEKRNLQLQNAARQQAARPVAAAKPAPAVPITQVLGAIGAAPKDPQPSKAEPSIGMTAAMNAIGASREEENRASIQKTKEQILKRLNAKPPEKPDEQTPAVSESKPERHKWGTPVKPPVADRPKWGEDGNLTDLHNMSLEETASQMEATNVKDVPAKSTEGEENESQPSNRKQWASKPSGTVVGMLKAAGLSETSSSNVSMASDTSENSSTTAQPSVGGSTVTLSKPSDNKLPVIGSTITISKCPDKGTVVIKKLEEPADQKDTPDAPADGVQSQKEMIISEEKEEDISEKDGPPARTTPPPPGDEKEDTVKQETKTDAEKAGVSATNKGLETDKKPRRDLTPPPRLKSRSPSPKPRSPKTSPVKPKKVYQPEVQVEVEDLPADKPQLFSKVDLDEEEVTAREEETAVLEDLEEGEIDMKAGTLEPGEVRLTEDEDAKQSSNSKLLLGLTTGHFDIGDVKLLRTCSEPNLAQLFKTNLVDNPFFTDEEVARSVNAAAQLLEEHDDDEDEDDAAQVRASLQKVMDDEEEDEDEDEENLGYSVKDIDDLIGDEDEEEDGGDEPGDADKDQETEEIADEEQEELESDEDDGKGSDAELETLRQSMMDILDNEGTISDEEAISSKKKSKKSMSKAGKNARKKRREKKQAEEAAAKAGGTQPKSMYARQWSASSVEDFQNMRETMKTLLQSDSDKKKLPTVKESVGAGGAGDGPTPETLLSLNSNTEAWQSDDDTIDDDYWEEEEDMFSRLEESRMKLEEELGCDTFMKAYKTVQAIHEDEDENMEEGLKLVTSILGDAKSHLYPSILQLVMADGVWTEDNE